MAPEIWRAIPGFPGYIVSDLGRVCGPRDRILRPGRYSKSGHVSVSLGRGNSKPVHWCVLNAFVGPAPPKHECRHLDDVPWNNMLCNLEWNTRRRNSQDKKHFKGTSLYKLTALQAIEVKAMIIAGLPGVEIAKRYGIAQSTVSAIRYGRFHNDV